MHELLPTTQGNATDDGTPLQADIVVQGIDHSIRASTSGNYYRYDMCCAYRHDDKPSR